jgi:hypothetical protein
MKAFKRPSAISFHWVLQSCMFMFISKEHFAYHRIKAGTPLSVDCYNVGQSMAIS